MRTALGDSSSCHMKGEDHVQIHVHVASSQAPKKETRAPTAPPGSSAKLLAQPHKGIAGEEKAVTAETKTMIIGERQISDRSRERRIVMPEGPITHFSYSQLSTYLTCPLRYRFQYVELIPPAFTSAD